MANKSGIFNSFCHPIMASGLNRKRNTAEVKWCDVSTITHAVKITLCQVRKNICRKWTSWRWIAAMWTAGVVALLDDEGVVRGGGLGAAWCQSLSLSKRNQLTSSLGAERHISLAFTEPRLLSPAFPGATRKTQVSAGLPVTYAHVWTHTHVDIIFDYNKIALSHRVHSQTLQHFRGTLDGVENPNYKRTYIDLLCSHACMYSPRCVVVCGEPYVSVLMPLQQVWNNLKAAFSWSSRR